MAKNKNAGMPKKRKNKNEKANKRPAILFAEGLAVVVLIAAAFFVPQVIFQVQDAVLCGNTVLSARENTDAESLSTTYEKSLPLRMTSFAEGLMGNSSFYVTSQELEPDEELRTFLYSDKGLYHEIIYTFMDGGLLPYEIEGEYYSVQQWKRYVIYSDDFAKGVNFILWYIELENEEGALFKMLVDAEDYTIYAIKTERNYSYTEYGEDYLRQYLHSDYVATQLWGYFASHFQAIDDEEQKTLYLLIEQYGWVGSAVDASFFDNTTAKEAVIASEEEVRKREMENFGLNEEEDGFTEGIEVSAEPADSMEMRMQRMVSFHQDDENTMSFRLPYGGAYLETVLKVQQPPEKFMFSDVMIGIRQICELIPEFA